MTDSTDSSSRFSGLSGFAPIDEPPDDRPHITSGRWAARAVFCVLVGLPLIALAVLFIGVAGGASLSLIAALALIGLKMGMRRAGQANEIAREQADKQRKQDEDLILAQRLAETRKRMSDEQGTR